jgi:S-formylglutathione hydrolase FrmB
MLRSAALLLLAAAPAFADGLRFEVSLPDGTPPQTGRLVVAVGPRGGRPDPTRTDPPCLPVLGKDADNWGPGKPLVVDAACDTFPLTNLNSLPAGEYTVQAFLLTNPDINLPTAPGNRSCEVRRVTLDPAAGTVVKLLLDKTSEERKPADTATHKFLHIPSKKLSAFHGRPMVYRVGVVLPPDFADTPNRKYALIVHIGGYGSRYTAARRIRPDRRFVQVMLDGAGPYGDPYQVDSANNGPYGAALTEEVIPLVEKTYRCLGTRESRFTTGGSTGGWVSLALQVFYPDYFNGCWSQCPDSVTFSAFELIDIYRDKNAYVNRFGFERASKRTIDGDTVFTLRHEVQIERVLGRGGRWELGGRDWCAWNATYGPRGADGKPAPLWDGKTGAIDPTVLNHWEKYDLVRVLDRNWSNLGPKLAGGKVHVWVGDADDYFLNNAVHRLKATLSRQTAPKFDGKILIDMRQPHTSGGWSDEQMRDEMAARAGVR